MHPLQLGEVGGDVLLKAECVVLEDELPAARYRGRVVGPGDPE
jgi:hypothetical protein